MRILPTINFQYKLPNIQPQNAGIIHYSKNLSCDRFEYSNNISFQSNVSEGQFLRKLSGIHDPYSGVVILNNKEMNQAYQDLAKLSTGKERVNYLKKYEASMLPIEHSVFELCRAEIKHNRYLSLKDILTQKQPKALTNLIKEQQVVFNKISKQVPNLSDENKNKVMSTILKAKQQILLPHEDKNHFKKTRFINDLIRISQDKNIKTIEKNILQLPKNEKLEALDRLYNAERLFLNHPYDINIQGKTPLERIQELQAEFAPETLDKPNEIEPLIDIASKLPTSKNSINAYIVEMYSKDDKTIAKRFISESLGTIEHIVPNSKGGANEAYNFLFVTKSRNEERSNMPMKEFLKKYPDIPKYCQSYMNDILKAGQSSKLRGYEWYPFVIKETLRNEIGANVSIKDYRVSPQKAFVSMPQRLKAKYLQFNMYFTNPQ